MPDSKFDLGDYVQVKDRIVALYDQFGMARIETTYELTNEPDDKPKVICRALVYRTPDDPHPSTGTSWMYLPGASSFTKGSEIENAETSAIGRAIGFLGILIDKSIASANEIAGKAGADAPAEKGEGPLPMVTGDGSLIGTAQVGKPPSDYELRATPTGQMLSFRLSDGRKSIKIVAYDTLAFELQAHRDEILTARVQCWGTTSIEKFTPKGTTKEIEYQVLTLHRITAPGVDLSSTPEPESLPLFSAEEEAALEATLDAA